MFFFNKNKKSKEQQLQEGEKYLYDFWLEYIKNNKHMDLMMILKNEFCPYWLLSNKGGYLESRLNDSVSIFEKSNFDIKNKNKTNNYIFDLYWRFYRSQNSSDEEKRRVKNVMASIDSLSNYTKIMRKNGVKLNHYEIIHMLMKFDMEVKKQEIREHIDKKYNIIKRTIYESLSGFKRFDSEKFKEYTNDINISHIFIGYLHLEDHIEYSLVDTVRFELVILIYKIEEELACANLMKQMNEGFNNRELIDILNTHINYINFKYFLKDAYAKSFPNLDLYEFLNYYFEFLYSHIDNEPRSKKLLKSYVKIMNSNNISASYNQLEQENEIQQKIIYELSNFTYVLKNLNQELNSSLIEKLENLELNFDSCIDYYYNYCVNYNKQSGKNDFAFEGIENAPGRSLSSAVKREVWRRDQGKCVDCKSNEFLEFDHIVPVSKGGSNSSRNIQLLCQKCNRKKSSKIS